MESRSYATISFRNNPKEYTYLTNLDLKEGDKVIVDSPHDGPVVVTVIKVKGLSKGQISVASKWIVQKVDMEAYYELVKRQELVQEIKNKLAQRKEEMEEMIIYKQLAKDDPEINSLLAELESLQNFRPKQIEEAKEYTKNAT